MLGENKFIQKMILKNFLSFGPEGQEIELKSLNVLIGPNASGKTNLISAIDFLRASAKDLAGPVQEGGGVSEWLWKGSQNLPVAEVCAIVSHPEKKTPLRHRIAFRERNLGFFLEDEDVKDAVENNNPVSEKGLYYYRDEKGTPKIYVAPEKSFREVPSKSATHSILAQFRDPISYPEITYLGRQYSKIKIYHDWKFPNHAPPRAPQGTDRPKTFLEEDASNLALVINYLEGEPGVRQQLINNLKKFSSCFVDFSNSVVGNTIQLKLHEEGLKSAVPAYRLSDGTLRYLCLLSILCHPSPPPLICLEEPELGLHPDILPSLADLLIEASQRTQIIVTTHSDILVDALTETPEAVIICEKENGSTMMFRHDTDQLKEWLEKYTLGDLWLRGQLGGNRW